MSESRVRIRRKQRLILENPSCCLCGGGVASTTEDHIPPKGCFPPGKHPEGTEFPACENCNQSTRKYDAIFGFYAMALDFNGENIEEDIFIRKIKGMLNNYPNALPKLTGTANQKRAALRRFGMRKEAGQSLADIGIFSPSPELSHAMNVAIRKMTCALYFKETSNIIPRSYRITGGWQQIQDRKRASILEYFDKQLTEYRQPTRQSVRDFGTRMCYKFGYMEKEDFFVFAAQIGDGLLLHGMTIAPDANLPSPWILPIWRVGDPWLPAEQT